MNGFHYDPRLFSFLKRPKAPLPETESYVSIPPALVIRDREGAWWTLGFDQGGWRTGEFEYDVIRRGPEPDAVPRPTGEHACRIEFRAGIIRIYGERGWRTWNYERRYFF
jgi:hypothetical protein